MKIRWVKQRLHAEFDIVREMWIARQSETPADLDVLGGIDEAEQGSVTKEAEEAAAKLLEDLEVNADRQRQAPEESCGSPENISGDAIQEMERKIDRLAEEKNTLKLRRLTITEKAYATPCQQKAPRPGGMHGGVIVKEIGFSAPS